MTGELSQLSMGATSIALVYEQLSWPQTAERFSELRAELRRILENMEIHVDVPETTEWYETARAEISQAILHRLASARSRILGDTVALPLFFVFSFVYRIATKLPFGLDVSQEREILTECLTDIGVGDLIRYLDDDIRWVRVEDDGAGDASITHYEIIRAGATFNQRVLEEWRRRQELGADAAKLFAALRDETRSVHIHGTASLKIQQAGAVHIERANQVTQEKAINIGNGVTVNAPVVVADHIANSFNAISDGALSDDVKVLMTELLSRIADASKTLQPSHAQTLARDAESLTKEITAERPRRKWYELSVEGLREAAVAVGAVGAPILETLGKLAPLLTRVWP